MLHAILAAYLTSTATLIGMAILVATIPTNRTVPPETMMMSLVLAATVTGLVAGAMVLATGMAVTTTAILVTMAALAGTAIIRRTG